MELIIEIEDDVLVEEIRNEVNLFFEILSGVTDNLKISQIIITPDFDKKVNEILETSDYQSRHGVEDSAVQAAAKIIDRGGTIIIVVSLYLYVVEIFNWLVRYFILFHEMIHVINKKNFPAISDDLSAQNFYLSFLYHLYDEYCADRLAYGFIEGMGDRASDASIIIWRKYIEKQVSGYLVTATDPQYYQQLCDEINKFRQHKDVGLLRVKADPIIDLVSITTVHAFAAYHQNIEEELEIPHTKLVNERTFALMDFFREKYDNANKIDTDLSDGISLSMEFITNFGMKFEDRPRGLYCYVMDI